jgi:hypothetical protein
MNGPANRASGGRRPAEPSLLAAARAGIRNNLVPGLVLQAAAVILVLCYYMVPAFAEWLAGVARLKSANGFLFSAVSTAVFGGLIPYQILLLTGQVPRGKELPVFLFYILLWAYKGVEVDAFYTLQGMVFGTDPNPGTVVVKTLADQFGYNVVWATPSLTVLFLWKDCGFDFRKLKSGINRRLWTFKMPSLLLSAWLVWIPAVLVIYAFPQALQVPVFNIVLCFWVLMMTFINRYNNSSEPGRVSPTA